MSLFERVSLPLAEASPLRLSNEMMAKMIPMFVNGGPGANHVCGKCFMFVPDGRCTVVDGKISGARGSCTYWAGGKNATEDKIHAVRMRKSTAGYGEVPAGMKIQCSTCEYLNGENYCGLWQGAVDAGDCCAAWDSPEST
jgi:hypothetical protein